jgi:hypothetical protein
MAGDGAGGGWRSALQQTRWMACRALEPGDRLGGAGQARRGMGTPVRCCQLGDGGAVGRCGICRSRHSPRRPPCMAWQQQPSQTLTAAAGRFSSSHSHQPTKTETRTPRAPHPHVHRPRPRPRTLGPDCDAAAESGGVLRCKHDGPAIGVGARQSHPGEQTETQRPPSGACCALCAVASWSGLNNASHTEHHHHHFKQIGITDRPIRQLKNHSKS